MLVLGGVPDFRWACPVPEFVFLCVVRSRLSFPEHGVLGVGKTLADAILWRIGIYARLPANIYVHK